jgi:hypothetical protein
MLRDGRSQVRAMPARSEFGELCFDVHRQVYGMNVRGGIVGLAREVSGFPGLYRTVMASP